MEPRPTDDRSDAQERPSPRREFTTRPRDGLASARRQGRTSWHLVVGALLLLVALGFWLHRLTPSAEHGPTGSEPAGAALGLQSDGSTAPGQPVAVAVAGETCRHWHVSAVEGPASGASRYLIVSSRVADPFGYVLGGFTEACGERHVILVVENLASGQLAAVVERNEPTALVVVGAPALDLARREAPGVPLLFALIQAPVQAGLDRADAVGISPWIPVAPMVRHCLRVLPRSAKNLIVLSPPGEWMGRLVAHAVRAIEAGGRDALSREITGGDGLDGRLESLAHGSDAWVVLPDRKVIDRRVFNRIQIAAERHRIPVCVSDEAHVRAGAFAGVGPDNHRVGRQLCRLAGAMERDTLPTGSRVYCPEYSFAVLHNAVVEKLGYMLDPGQLEQAKLYKWH